ncbi:MAG: pantetheine-phosphate adenylyltransferase [Candidatus Omnitrophota bacterium]
MSHSIAVYPGSFDPVTYGHLDLIERGAKLFERLIVAVVSNPGKSPLFTLEERLAMLREAVKGIEGDFIIDSFDGLLVHYMRMNHTHVILRGLRAVSDFEYEFELALTNRRMAQDIETIFMAPSEEHIFLRATLVKEISRLGGDVSAFVPPLVERRLMERRQQKIKLPV